MASRIFVVTVATSIGVTAACSGDPASPARGANQEDAATGTDGSPKSDAPTMATKSIGAEGGTISAEGVTVEVPPGAVAAPTDFVIRKVSVPSLPAGVSLVGDAYELLPSGVTFAKPVKVTLPAPSGLEAGEHVMIRLPSGGTEWLPVGAPDTGKTSVVGYTKSFSVFALVRMLFEQVGCNAPDNCSLVCAPETLSCTGTCSVRNAQAIGATCTVEQDGRIGCSCSGASAIPPRTSEKLYVDFLDGLMRPQLLVFAIANHCGWPCPANDAGADAAPDGPNDASSGDTGSGQLLTPTCFTYGTGNVQSPIVRAAGRLFWSAGSGAIGAVHSVTTDLTDFKTYPNHVGATAITANASGVFWFNQFPPQDAGLTAGMYRLALPYSSGNTPTFQAALSGSSGRMAATDANVFFTSRPSLDYVVNRANAQGQSAEALITGSVIADQMEAVGGYVYWIESTAAAAAAFCNTPSKVMPQVLRFPVSAQPPVTPEVVLDGCKVLAASLNPSEAMTRFVTDGTHVFAQSDRGEIWKVPVGGGTPARVFQPFFPKAGSGGPMAIVGTNVVFSDQDTAVGASPGMKKLPLGGGSASARFALNYTGANFAADGTAIYFANQSAVCKLPVP